MAANVKQQRRASFEIDDVNAIPPNPNRDIARELRNSVENDAARQSTEVMTDAAQLGDKQRWLDELSAREELSRSKSRAIGMLGYSAVMLIDFVEAANWSLEWVRGSSTRSYSEQLSTIDVYAGKHRILLIAKVSKCIDLQNRRSDIVGYYGKEES